MVADSLGLTRTSITRAFDQLVAMGLIEQEKVGKRVEMAVEEMLEELVW